MLKLNCTPSWALALAALALPAMAMAADDVVPNFQIKADCGDVGVRTLSLNQASSVGFGNLNGLFEITWVKTGDYLQDGAAVGGVYAVILSRSQIIDPMEPSAKVELVGPQSAALQFNWTSKQSFLNVEGFNEVDGNKVFGSSAAPLVEGQKLGTLDLQALVAKPGIFNGYQYDREKCDLSVTLAK